jgi:1,4-alpha-glucan branching enzyme
MHDTLAYFREDPLHRRWHHAKLTFGMLYHWTERFTQALSHDEVVHGKGSLIHKMGAPDLRGRAANLRALLALQWAWPGKKTLFMGCEFGQSAEWSHQRSLDWHLLGIAEHAGLQRLVADLNRLLLAHPSLAAADFDSSSFAWVAADDAEASVLAFRREAGDERWLVVANLTPVPRTYRLGVTRSGRWDEVLNTDSSHYSGGGAGNLGGLQADAIGAHGQAHSIEAHLPGLSVLVFRHR